MFMPMLLLLLVEATIDFLTPYPAQYRSIFPPVPHYANTSWPTTGMDDHNMISTTLYLFPTFGVLK